MKIITVRVSKAFAHQLRVTAAQWDMNRSQLIRLALTEKLDKLDRSQLNATGPNWADYDLGSEVALENDAHP